VTAAGVRRRCQARLDELRAAGLVIPKPFNAVDLTTEVSSRLDRRIDLVGIDMPAGAPYGLTLWTRDDGYVVAYDRKATRVHQDLIIGHELAHILLDHQPVALDDPAAVRLIFPSLSPDLVRRTLRRTGSYGPLEEQEAEMMATLLIGFASHPDERHGTDGLSQADADLCSRLRESFERPT
jgi:hypothetical protein